MSTIEPIVEVYNIDALTSSAYGQAGKIALIGAFPTSTFKLDLFTDASNAKAALRGSVTAEQLISYKAYHCLDYIFSDDYNIKGPESVVIVNTNYGKGTLVTASSNADIAAACLLLAEENFDILGVAEPILLATEGESNTTVLNPIFSTLKSFVDSQFRNQKPFGMSLAVDLTGADTTLLALFKELFKKQGIYKAVVTEVQIAGDANALTIEQSACWHAMYTSGRPVNKSETKKVYSNLTGKNTKDIYPASTVEGAITFDNLRENGFLTLDYKDRRSNTVECISNITPVGYDMKAERIKNYMLRRLTLDQYLGDDNTRLTMDTIDTLFKLEKDLAVEAGLLLDMPYNIQPIDSETVKAQVELIIPEIIRRIILEVSYRVANYEEVGV